jgi:hypothetical protein
MSVIKSVPTQGRCESRGYLATLLLQLFLGVGMCTLGCTDDRTVTQKTQNAPPPSMAAPAAASSGSGEGASGDAAHARLFAASRFPSATACGQCHPTEYRQWSISQHAYAQMSPVFNAMQGKIIKGTNGTNGDFCIRCHTQVGMNLGEPQFMSNIDRNPTSREGISCVICHRVSDAYGKISGRFAIDEADITQPVKGPTGNNVELDKAIENAGLITDPNKSGRKVHSRTTKFFQITTSAFCGTCHDVNLLNGFRLEEAFSEYKHAPAALRGLQCQDCHMGKEPGRALADRSDPGFFKKNYAFGPAAKVGSFETAPRMLTNHKFVGPDYSVLPPSLFPLNIAAIKEESEKNDPKARGLATIREWITFDWKAGWGTDAFEDSVPDNYKFPPRWATEDDRRDARKIVDDNLKLLDEIKLDRLELLRNGYKLGAVNVDSAGPDGIKFSVQINSGTDGHNVPTGFDAERLVWIHVAVRDADGKVIKESGDLDPNGDLRDLSSNYVHNNELPVDDELVSLQGAFVVRMQRGSERDQILATNFSPSPLPFLRPEREADILVGRPISARKQKNSIEPLGERWGHYEVTKSQLTGRAPYTVHVEIKAAMVPVNLVNDIRSIGFDYNLSPYQITQNLIAGHMVVWDRDVVLVK